MLAAITDPSLQAEIDTAQARLNEARANLASQEAGGKPADFTEIENSLARAQFDLAQAQKTLASLQRLAAQHAATQQEADAAREKVQAERTGNRRTREAQEVAGFAHGSDGGPGAGGRCRDGARPGARSAPHCLSCGRRWRAWSTGAKCGRDPSSTPATWSPTSGRMDQLRVRVYVDEPELGRVAVGQPVTITWDALPGRQWHGTGGEEAGRRAGAGLAPGGRSGVLHRE